MPITVVIAHDECADRFQLNNQATFLRLATRASFKHGGVIRDKSVRSQQRPPALRAGYLGDT